MASHNLRLKSRDVATVSMFSALIVSIRLIHIPLHIPGFGSIPWIALLIIARAISTYPATASTTGLIAGTITTVAGLDVPPGPHQIVKYVVSGAVIDSIYALYPKVNLPLYVLEGALTSISKVLSVYIMTYLLGIPIVIVKLLLTYTLALNALLGSIAGLIAYYITSIIMKNRRR